MTGPKLTIEAARALKHGETLYDHNPKTRGLELRARGTKKSWHVYYRINGRQRRPKIGEFPAQSIDVAREIAQVWLNRVRKGEDPYLDREHGREAPTVNKLIDHYLNVYGKAEYADSTHAHASTLMRLYVRPALGPKRVLEVSVADCNSLFDRIAEGRVKIPSGRKLEDGSPEMIYCAKSQTNANATRRYLSKAFALAEGDSLKWRPRNSNPCQDEETKSFPVKRRRVHIYVHEFRALNDALIELAKTYPWHIACLYVILYVGGRVTEIAKARRSEIVQRRVFDQDTGKERVESYLVKGEHKTAAHIGEKDIFLPEAALAIIEKLPMHKGGWLFGPVGEMKAPKDTIWRIWDKARELAKVRPELQARDLRRTFASVARTHAGATLEDIAPLLHHTDTKTTEGYAYLFEDSKRNLVNRTADAIRGFLEGPKD